MILSTLLILAAAPPTLPAEEALAPGIHRVYVGAYLTDVSDFDLKAGRFKADLRVWLKWLGGDEPPVLTFENAEIDSKDELGKEQDGAWHSVQWRVQATFRGDFPVHDFPFDVQTLPVVFGMDEAHGLLVPDLGASGMSPRFSITGWNYEPYFNARSEVKTFGSDLGSIANEGKNAKLRRVGFSVELHRPFRPYLLKFMVPLALILLMALLALLLPAPELEVRSAMGVTAVLSTIAFHYTQSDTLPNVTYLVAADKVFLGAYVFVTITLLISVLAFRAHEKKPEVAHAWDRAGLYGLPVVTVLAFVILFAGVGAPTAAAAPVPVAKAPRVTQPLLKIGVGQLDTVATGLPTRRSATSVKNQYGDWQGWLVEDPPAMVNPLVRLLPDGGMRVRWRLRPNLKWSDGQPITLDDFKFSIQSFEDPDRKSVEVVDDRTLDLTYSVRRREPLNALTVVPHRALEKAFADGGRDALLRSSIELGVPTAAPYLLKEFTVGQRAVLERNPNFALDKPYFDRIEVVATKENGGADALKSREVDALSSISGPTYAALEGDDSVRFVEQPGDMLYLLVPNLTQPPFDDLEVRKAVLQAIDREALVKAFAPLPAMVATTWKPASTADPHAAHDLAAAAARLEKLGLKGARLQLHHQSVKGKTAAILTVANKVAENLTAAGLQVELVEHAETGPLFNKRDYHGLLLVSRDARDPVRFFNVPYVNGHYATEKPLGPHFDQAMADAYQRFDTSLYDERRAALEAVLERLWAERLPMLPLVLTSRLAAVRKDLAGPELGDADNLWWNLADWHFEQK